MKQKRRALKLSERMSFFGLKKEAPFTLTEIFAFLRSTLFSPRRFSKERNFFVITPRRPRRPPWRICLYSALDLTSGIASQGDFLHFSRGRFFLFVRRRNLKSKFVFFAKVDLSFREKVKMAPLSLCKHISLVVVSFVNT